MAVVQNLIRSFAGGEIAREMYGRLDLDKFQTGLQTCRNFVTLPHGPAQSRAGTEYVNETKDSTKKVKLFPFSYNSDQTNVCEFGHHYVRFHTGGETILETSKTITGVTIANPAVVTSAAHGFVDGEWVFPVGIVGPDELNGRFYKLTNVTANTFMLQGLDGSTISSIGMAAYVSGGTVARVYTVTTDYDAADVFDINYTQDNDVLTLVHPTYPTRELRRLGAANWTLVDVDFKPSIPRPEGLLYGSFVGSGTDKFEYVVTAVNAAGVEESYPSLPSFVATLSVTVITQASPAVFTTGAVHGLVASDRCYLENIDDSMPDILDGVYIVELAPTTTTLQLKRLDGVLIDSTAYPAYTGGGSVHRIHITNNLGTAGNKNELAWDPVTGAQRYNIYKQRNGLYGYIGQTADTRFFDDNIVPDPLRSPPDPYNATPFEAAGDYPGAVGYHEQRRGFGGTNNRPTNFWFTRPGTEGNLSNSIPTQADDAIAGRIVSGQQNRILHIVPLDDLLFLTTGGEARVVTQNSDSFAVGTFSIKMQTYIGSTKVKPIVTANSVLFIQSRGAHLREMSYTWEKNAYASPDISIMAPHLFRGITIPDMAFTLAPLPVAWLVRDDGVLLGLTYVPEQKVFGWHHHDTEGGFFESVAAVKEGNADRLYAVVRRTINGRTVRYIERLGDREFTMLEDAFCVDSGLTYDGAPTSVVTGLWHLEGWSVSILADGGVHPKRTVAGGQITLDDEYSKVHIGIQITAEFETLPVTIEQAPAFGRGLIKNVNQMLIRVEYSNSIWAGPSLDKLTLFRSTGMGVMGTPPPLLRETVKIMASPKWGYDGTCAIRQTDPLPITVVCIVPEDAI